jgi:hypothetical protein
VVRDSLQGDSLDIAENVVSAQEMLEANHYDAIFLDHDLHPETLSRRNNDDERTGYAIALWLSTNPDVQRASTILVHTRNADGAMRMVEHCANQVGRLSMFRSLC